MVKLLMLVPAQISELLIKLSFSMMFIILSIERNPFSAQNQTLRSYRRYISPTK